MVMVGGLGLELTGDAAGKQLRHLLEQDSVAIAGASVDAVVETTNEIKEQIRAYIDAHFTGSQIHGNNHRRVANASAQSIFYDDREEKGQYTGLIYSKFGRGKGPGSFVDFLLLHMRGGVVRPRDGDWIRIPNKAAVGYGFIGGQTGNYRMSGSSIFFSKSKDGQKMFLLRSRGKGRQRRTELLATLVRFLAYPARLSGIDAIAASREVVFLGRFAQALDRRMGSST